MEAARRVKHVGAHPVGDVTYLSGDSTDVNREAPPLSGQIIESVSGVATRQSSNKKRAAVFESWGFESYDRHVLGVPRHSFLLIYFPYSETQPGFLPSTD